MNLRLCLLILIATVFFVTASSHAATGEFRISNVEHPDIAGQQIYAIAGNSGKRVFGLRNRVFIESEDGSTQTYDSSNSPIIVTGTITGLALTNQELWLAQSAPSQRPGVLRYADNKWHFYQEPDAPGLLNGRIVCIHVDEDDFVWLGHHREGISKFVEAVNPVFNNTKIMHLYDNDLLAVHMQITHLWIGTANGIVRYRTDIRSNYDLNIDKWVFPEFPAREAFSISTFTDNQIVAGTSRGLAIFDGKKWQLKGKAEGILALPVTHIQRSGDRLWLGSPAGLQLWSASGSEKFFTTTDGLPANNITALGLDENGNLLVGTEKGAAIISAPQQ